MLRTWADWSCGLCLSPHQSRRYHCPYLRAASFRCRLQGHYHPAFAWRSSPFSFSSSSPKLCWPRWTHGAIAPESASVGDSSSLSNYCRFFCCCWIEVQLAACWGWRSWDLRCASIALSYVAAWRYKGLLRPGRHAFTNLASPQVWYWRLGRYGWRPCGYWTQTSGWDRAPTRVVRAAQPHFEVRVGGLAGRGAHATPPRGWASVLQRGLRLTSMKHSSA